MFSDSIYLFTLSPSITSASNQDSICFDLYGPTCAPGELKDPTGKSKAQNYQIFDRKDFESTVNLEIGQEVDKILNDTNNNKFYEVAAEAFGVNGLPGCEMIRNKDCKERVSEALKNQLRHEIFYNDIGDNSKNPDLKDLTSISYLSEHKLMGQLKNNLKKTADNYLNRNKVMDKVKDEIFPNVQKLLHEWLIEVLPPGRAKDNILFKVDHIEFSGFDCTRGKIDVPSDLQPNAFYELVGNKVTYCKGSLQQTESVFAIVRTIANELAHSIDPCSIQFYLDNRKFKYKGNTQAEMEQEYPFKNIINCLRDKKSIEAKQYTPSTLNQTYFGQTSMGSGMGFPNQMSQNGLAVNNQPNQVSENTKFDFCNKHENGVLKNGDQIGESICDWVAIEILPRYIERHYKDLSQQDYRLGYLNVYRHYCYPHNHKIEKVFSTHPSFEKRANSLLLVNPKVREKMGCTKELSDALYCDPKMITKPDSNAPIDGSANKAEGAI